MRLQKLLSYIKEKGWKQEYTEENLSIVKMW